MIREYTNQVMVNKVTKKIYCDDCDAYIEARRSSTCCYICNKDICRKCVAYDAPTMGDYSEVYCKTCMEIKYKYDELMKPLEDEIDKLYENMITECKSKRNL